MRRICASRRRRRGLTLIELVVVISIVLVLMGIALTVYIIAARGAKDRITGAVNTRDRAHVQEIQRVMDEEDR